MPKKSKKEETEVEDTEEDSFSSDSDSEDDDTAGGSEDSDESSSVFSFSSSEESEEETPKKSKKGKKVAATPSPKKDPVSEVVMIIDGPHDANDEPIIYFIPTNTENEEVQRFLTLVKKQGEDTISMLSLAKTFYKVKSESKYKSTAKYEEVQQKAMDDLDKLIEPFTMGEKTDAIKIVSKYFFFDSVYE